MTYAQALALVLSFSLLLPPVTLAWAKGTTGLPGGFHFELSGANIQLRDSSENVIWTGVAGASGGLQTPRVAVGAAGSALPAYVGGVGIFQNGSDGVVKGVDFSGCTNMSTNDFMFYLSSSAGWSGANGTSQMATTSMRSDSYRDRLGTSGALFPLGLATSPGYGIVVGSTAANIPQTNAVDIYNGIATAGPALTTRLMSTTGNGGLNVTYGATLTGNIGVTKIYSGGYYGGGVAIAAAFPNGLSTAANTGIGIGVAAPTFNGVRILKGTNPLVGYTDCQTLFTDSASESLVTTSDSGPGYMAFGKRAKPTAPTNYETIYNDIGTNAMSVVNSGSTSRAM